ncbi:MAG: HDOD domain-containing protein [Candidatus Thiodiazotropha taylori]|nr:HDOD domain-containing protein [Candidatus Thiodiazotropha taylori]MCG8053906.1 HDOD domain-containing protein [Candidatus Thiodiazotropha taylori]MCW4315727.1 HDOD domain-containing protein [Candidatus Thiodiazotropha taylori]
MTTPNQDKAIDGKFCDLPSPPAILIQLIDSCNDPNVSFESLSAIIQQDAAITSQVMAAANSPFYRQWNEFTSLHHMLVVLGMNSVRTIAINSAVQQYFSKLSDTIGQSLDLIWSRSLFCAFVCRSLADLTAYKMPEEAYLAGLLHRLGQLALLQKDTQGYQKLVDANSEIEKQLKQELKQYGVSYPVIGSQMIDQWQLHSFLADALRYQYEPADRILDSAPLVKLVNLGCQLALGETKPDDAALTQADNLFGLNQSVIEKLTAESFKQATESAGSLGIPFLKVERDDDDEADSAAHRIALAERVEQAALFGGSLTPPPDKADRHTTLQQIHRDLELLFGLKRACFLLKADEEALLLPYSPASRGRQQQLEELSFGTETDRSLAALAFNKQMRVTTDDEAHQANLTVADQQLMGFIDSEVVCYLPLTAQQQRLGVLAIGLESDQIPLFETQLPMLHLFTRQACETLLRQQEMRQSQQQLLEDERAAFHLEARKVVHEANNPLGIINNYLHILGMKLGENHEVQEELDIIKDEINRVGKILLRMRDIPEELEQQEKGLDINALIKDLHKLFQSSLFATHNTNTEVDLDPDIPLIASRRGHIKQILTNLIKNAVEAMPEGGKLSIATRDNAYLNGKAHIEIEVVDSGPGIDAEIMDQLFLPGKSTKDSSHSGLGLAIIKSLMDELSGVVNCTSNSNSGTRFQLFLPRSTRE